MIGDAVVSASAKLSILDAPSPGQGMKSSRLWTRVIRFRIRKVEVGRIVVVTGWVQIRFGVLTREVSTRVGCKEFTLTTRCDASVAGMHMI